MTWTDERKAEASRLWHEEKKSFGQIAKELGVTLGAVAGLANRAKWTRRKEQPSTGARKKAQIAKPVAAAPRPIAKPVVVAEKDEGREVFNRRKVNTKQVQFSRAQPKMTRSEMEAMLREAVSNTRAMEE